jgi:hypothetical protein
MVSGVAYRETSLLSGPLRVGGDHVELVVG